MPPKPSLPPVIRQAACREARLQGGDGGRLHRAAGELARTRGGRPTSCNCVRQDSWAKPLSGGPFDAIHAFTRSRAEIEASLGQLEKALKRDGMIWVSWPKKAAKVATDVTEDVVRAAALKLDLVDVKVAALDAVWSGLKLVIRKDRR